MHLLRLLFTSCCPLFLAILSSLLFFSLFRVALYPCRVHWSHPYEYAFAQDFSLMCQCSMHPHTQAAQNPTEWLNHKLLLQGLTDSCGWKDQLKSLAVHACTLYYWCEGWWDLHCSHDHLYEFYSVHSSRLEVWGKQGAEEQVIIK